jgi:hypothetical protein
LTFAVACGMSIGDWPVSQALPCTLKEFNLAAFQLFFHQ